MTRSRKLLGVVLSAATTCAVVLGTSIPASAATTQTDVWNEANSAHGYAKVSVYSYAPDLDAVVVAFDIKADGYCARAQLFLINHDGTYAAVSDIAKACGVGTNATAYIDQWPRGDIDHAILRVWNGTGEARNGSFGVY